MRNFPIESGFLEQSYVIYDQCWGNYAYYRDCRGQLLPTARLSIVQDFCFNGSWLLTKGWMEKMNKAADASEVVFLVAAINKNYLVNIN